MTNYRTDVHMYRVSLMKEYRLLKKCQQLSTNIYHCLPDELYETCRDGDGEGERRPKTIYYAGQIFQANYKIFRAKLSFIGQEKTEKRFHLNNFKYYEVCAQSAQGQR